MSLMLCAATRMYVDFRTVPLEAQHGVLEERRVGEIQRGVEADARRSAHAAAAGRSAAASRSVPSACRLDDRDPRSHAPIEERRERNDDAGEDAVLDVGRERERDEETSRSPRSRRPCSRATPAQRPHVDRDSATASMIIAARTGFGRWWSYGVKNSSVTSTDAAAKSDESPSVACDARFNAERENDPLTGIDWQNAAAIFARPCPTSSWFSSHRDPLPDGDDLAARHRLHEADQRDDERRRQQRRGSPPSRGPGTRTPGRPAGMSPTTRPPRSAKPSA